MLIRHILKKSVILLKLKIINKTKMNRSHKILLLAMENNKNKFQEGTSGNKSSYGRYKFPRVV